MAQFDVIVLAAQRDGVINPLAEAHRISHKCLIPVAGIPLLERVLKTLADHPGCRAIHIVIDSLGRSGTGAITEKFERSDLSIDIVDSSANLVDSIMSGCEAATAPYLITTADNVLLSHESIDRMMAGLETGADALFALTTKQAVHTVHEEAQRFFYRLRDDQYANCNLYAIRDSHALNAAEVFREGGQFMNHPMRLVRAFGMWNIMLVALRLVAMEQATKRMSRRFGLEIRAIYLTDGTQAIDVDNERTYNIVQKIITGEIKEDDR